jgi:glutathione S-transferase
MRARLAVQSAGIQVELREILLRDKAPAFLQASPSATVPCLVTKTQTIDESRDIMLWALAQNDPEGWLDMPDDGFAIIDVIDGPFKTALDRYKYSTRYADADKAAERTVASAHLYGLNERLAGQTFLFGGNPTLADMAILPFVRQFAMTDKAWFDAQDWPHLSRWVEAFLASERFLSIMTKYKIWTDGDPVTHFPDRPSGA